MLKILVHKYRVNLFIGATPEERANKQPLDIYIDIEMNEPPRPCTWTLNNTIDWNDIAYLIESTCTKKEFELIESLSDELLKQILTLPQVKKISLTIRKLNALSCAAYTAVSQTYER